MDKSFSRRLLAMVLGIGTVGSLGLLQAAAAASALTGPGRAASGVEWSQNNSDGFLLGSKAQKPAVAIARTFYVRPDGDDRKSGLSPATAWRSLSKVSLADLAPGSQVLFERSGTFRGTLRVNRSGVAGKPIVFGAYGSGPKPVIDGSSPPDGRGAVLAPILVQDQDHIHFRDLTVTNNRTKHRDGVSDAAAFGLLVVNTGRRNLTHFRVDRLTLRDVSSITIRPDFDSNYQSGLVFQSLKPQRAVIGDIVVRSSNFLRGTRFGAQFLGVRNSAFRDNRCDRTGGSCLLVHSSTNVLLERNTINLAGSKQFPRQIGRGSGAWFYNSQYVVAQRNTVYGSQGSGDSSSIHVDLHNKHILLQYNRVFENAGYGLEILGDNTDVIVRYNISINDGYRKPVSINGRPHGGMLFLSGWEKNSGIWIYNNTFMTRRSGNHPFWIQGTNDGRIFNNIFAALGDARVGPLFNNRSAGNLVVTNNLFVPGNTSTDIIGLDSRPVLGMPRFTGGEGYYSAASYRLAWGSPAIRSGIWGQASFDRAGQGIFAHVAPVAWRDFFGIELPWDRRPNIGAYQGGGLRPVP
ncbi:right-handed parallel beta-helix repeat-containing protein [Streptomyces sp. NPDC003038]|uniref:right-handed parallel beta-helix repeat-containing protein n=1 Tax=unclassified Streptomyces TaxID=2593676 RepID=UPI0033B1EE44